MQLGLQGSVKTLEEVDETIQTLKRYGRRAILMLRIFSASFRTIALVI